jgi:hypothetical protein
LAHFHGARPAIIVGASRCALILHREWRSRKEIFAVSAKLFDANLNTSGWLLAISRSPFASAEDERPHEVAGFPRGIGVRSAGTCKSSGIDCRMQIKG